MKRAAIYARVSLDKTGEQQSVARQLEACRGLAVARGWDVVEECVDNSISAWSNKQRPAWERVLTMLERGEVDVVIAWHLDRLTRSMKELERLIALSVERGAGVATATGDIDLTTDTGRMVARILAAVAAQEVERKAARQRLANAQRAATGAKTNGHRPFGWTQDQTALVEDEAALLRSAARSIIAGIPLGAVAREWREAGVPSARTGEPGAWSPSTVRMILLNPRMVGARVYHGEIVAEGAFPPVLDLSTFETVKALLEHPRRSTGSAGGSTPQNLLSGIAKCATCGAGLNVAPADEKNGRRHASYRCQRGHVMVHRDALDLYVETLMVERLSKPDLLIRQEQGGSLDLLLQERTQLELRLEGLALGFAEGALSYEQMVAGTESLRGNLKALEGRVGALTAIPDFKDFAHVDDTQAVWDGLTLGRRRRLVERMLDIEVSPPGRGFRGGFKPECVTYRWTNAEKPPA